MALEKILKISGKGVPVMGDEIDTDRIIPARFMKCVTFDGLGEFAFFDAIKEAEAASRVHPFKDKKFTGASVLISGANFGCGSSREHAPQSLYRAGVRAIIAESFAEIFFGNSTTLGIPCVTLPREKLNKLASIINEDPEEEIDIEMNTRIIRVGEWEAGFAIPETAYQALVEGKWDPIAELLEAKGSIGKVAESLPYIFGY
jgi:3-isopropylmalate/(R)-2-methylmalate dehydratase small subunit